MVTCSLAIFEIVGGALSGSCGGEQPGMWHGHGAGAIPGLQLTKISLDPREPHVQLT